MWMTRVAINNPVFATMVMAALCVLGLFAYLRLGVEQLPDVAPPMAYIDVRYPGASAEAVERGWITGDAAALYRAAITAHMQMLGVAQTDITSYLANTRVAYAGLPSIGLGPDAPQQFDL